MNCYKLKVKLQFMILFDTKFNGLTNAEKPYINADLIISVCNAKMLIWIESFSRTVVNFMKTWSVGWSLGKAVKSKPGQEHRRGHLPGTRWDTGTGNWENMSHRCMMHWDHSCWRCCSQPLKWGKCTGNNYKSGQKLVTKVTWNKK